MLRRLALVAALALGGCAGWSVPVGPTPRPVDPVRPDPPPVPDPDRPPPPPPDPKALEPFLAVKVGDAETSLDALPGVPTVTQVGSRTIRSWRTTVPRPKGGTVVWEVHTEGGKVTHTFPW